MARTGDDRLRETLDAVVRGDDGAVPSAEALALLAVRVRREQRHALYRDLLRFWAVAGTLLAAVLYSAALAPVAFLLWQAIAAVLMLVGGAAWTTLQGQVDAQ